MCFIDQHTTQPNHTFTHIANTSEKCGCKQIEEQGQRMAQDSGTKRLKMSGSEPDSANVYVICVKKRENMILQR